MAGKLRFAVIFVTLTSMLSAGGGAAYYFTHGGKLPFGFGARPDASLSADASATHVANGDLGALENAWAEAGSANTESADHASQHASAESAPTARSANVATDSAEISTDRYASNSDSAYPARDAPQNVESTAVETSQAAGDRYASSAVQKTQPADLPAHLTDEPSSTPSPSGAASPVDSVARGQEPSAIAEIEPIDVAADSNPAAAAVRSATSESGEAAGSLKRAREAFRDTPQPGANPRYSGAATAPRSLDPSAAQNAASINPFAAQPAANGDAAPDMAPIEAIEPVPTDAEATELRGGSINERDGGQTNATTLPAAENRALRGAYSGTSAGYGNTGAASTSAREPNKFASDLGSHVGSAAVSPGEGTGRPGERALEGPQKPALVIQKVALPEIQVGKSAKFLVKVQNIGGQTASDVVIRDEVPEGTRLVGTSPTAEVAGSQLTWNIGKLSTGEERIVEIDLQPTTEGEIGSVATVSYSAQASAKTRCTMPQLAIRMTAPDEVMLGQEQRIKIELHNPGSGDASGVMIFENVPENLRHEAGAALEFEIGTLKPGETRELELVLIAEKAGKVVNVLSARADGNLQVQQQVEFEVIAPALAVAVDGPGRRYLERAATYQVIVENPGTAPARDVELVTKLPKGMRFVRANNMGEYDASSHAVYWSLAELPEGERGTVELVAMPIETGAQTLEVEGRAQQGLTDQTEQQVMIEGIASIMFEVRDAEDPIEVGGETSYEIRVANEGTKAATNVRVAINMTPGMKLISAEGETQHDQQGAAIVFAPLPQLAPKTDTLYRVKVKGTEPGDQRINVEVSSDDLSQPIRREESTRVFGDE